GGRYPANTPDRLLLEDCTMPSILRWFEHEGVRHRAWVRYAPDATIADARPTELVVAGPDWEQVVRDVDASDVDQLSPETLVRLAELAAERGRRPRQLDAMP